VQGEPRKPSSASIDWSTLMDWKKWWPLPAAVMGLFVAWWVGAQWTKGYQFHEVALDDEKKVLQDLGNRITLNVDTTSTDGLLGVVGLVLIVDNDKVKSGKLVFDRTDVIPTLRPSGEMILVAPINKTLYNGKISNTLDAGGSYTSFKGGLSSNQAAEVVIVDELYVGYRDRTKIPYDRLYKLKAPEGKTYYFVHGATVTSTTYRVFDEASSNGALEGASFKANGKVYTSSNQFAYRVTLAIDAFNVQALHAAEAGPGPPAQILSLYQQYVTGKLDAQGADKLVGLLRAGSADAGNLIGAELKPIGP
jgi:hypothetical protein